MGDVGTVRRSVYESMPVKPKLLLLLLLLLLCPLTT